MLGLTPDPLSAGVGMHVAVAGPYTATNGSPRGRTVQTRNGRIPAGGSVSSGRARAPDGALARLSQTTVYDTDPRSEYRRRYYELAFFASSSSTGTTYRSASFGSSLAGAESFYPLKSLPMRHEPEGGIVSNDT